MAHTQQILHLFLLTALLASCGSEGVQLTETADEKAANEVLLALDRAGIAATKERGRARNASWTVEVEAERLVPARELLKQLDLPRAARMDFAELLADSSLIPSKANEHARLLHAIAEELAGTLESHERVLSARVHIVQPEQSLSDKLHSRPPLGRPTASVVIRYSPSSSAQSAPKGERQESVRDAALEGARPDLFQETLAEVFAEMADNSQQRLVDAIRKELRLIAAGMTTRSALPEDDSGETAASSSAQPGSSSGWSERLESAVLQALQSATATDLASELAATGDSSEVRFVKQMLRDFYKLPASIRELTEERYAAENLDWPFSRSEVRMLVAHAVEGLWPWDVNVVFSSLESSVVNASFRRNSSVSTETAPGGRRTQPALLQTGGELAANQQRIDMLGYLVAALGVATCLLLLLLTRERRRNSKLRTQLGTTEVV